VIRKEKTRISDAEPSLIDENSKAFIIGPYGRLLTTCLSLRHTDLFAQLFINLFCSAQALCGRALKGFMEGLPSPQERRVVVLQSIGILPAEALGLVPILTLAQEGIRRPCGGQNFQLVVRPNIAVPDDLVRFLGNRDVPDVQGARLHFADR